MSAKRKAPAKKKAPKKKPAPAPKKAKAAPKAIATDGSKLDAVLDLLGAPKARPPKEAAEIERWLGKKLPKELARYLARPVDLDEADADHPEIGDTSWLGELPDVGKWLAQLAKPFEGELQAVHQLVGVVPIGVRLDRGDFMFALAGVEAWGPLESGGVYYYDEREMGGWDGGTISGFLLQEMEKLWKEIDGARDEMDDEEEDAEPEEVDLDDLRDCFRLRAMDTSSPPPKALPLSPALTKKWVAHRQEVTAWFPRVRALLEVLHGRPTYLERLPDEALWKAQKKLVATSHPRAMYWLLAHWLLGNGPELAEAVTLSKKNPSKLVAALRAFVTTKDASKMYAKQQKVLFDRVRASAAK